MSTNSGAWGIGLLIPGQGITGKSSRPPTEPLNIQGDEEFD